MPALGGLKRLKNIFDKIKKVGGKVIKFDKDRGIDLAVKGIKLLKSGKIDTVLNLVKTFIPQAAIASEVVERLKSILNKVDEDKLRDVLKKELSGDLTELRNLSDVYIKNSDSSVNSYKNFFSHYLIEFLLISLFILINKCQRLQNHQKHKFQKQRSKLKIQDGLMH